MVLKRIHLPKKFWMEVVIMCANYILNIIKKKHREPMAENEHDIQPMNYVNVDDILHGEHMSIKDGKSMPKWSQTIVQDSNL